jgi:PhzF family phenazine biosynthesis protein
MKLPIFQIDAFTGNVFAGNPAAVCPLEQWLDAHQLQAIASENNLAETAFFVKQGDTYELRWFTPVMEVDLCGHATLASAFVIFNYIDTTKKSVTFQSRSGELGVSRDGDLLSLDFPTQEVSPCQVPNTLIEGLGKPPQAVLASLRDYFVVYGAEADIRQLEPNFPVLTRLDRFAVIVTAPGDYCDFVSRFFAPKAGVPEDPVTGSAHCSLIPYWSKQLGKQKLHAFQISQRQGELFCEALGDRVLISGRAVRYLEGTIYL